jgi:gliding motility-associated-like protein
MTLLRTTAIAFLCFAMTPFLSGQSPAGSPHPAQLREGKVAMLESAAPDTSGILQVPNVFSPNDDQINDYFEVKTDGVTVYDFMVFTRTGTRVFRSNSPRIFWDGRGNNGLPVKEGIYYFIIEEAGSGDGFEKAGFIYLFR